MITSHSQLGEPLWTFINNRVRITDTSENIPPPEPYPEADYYLLASLLQKAIRRGDFLNARRAGHQLYGIARNRLWYRLMVIALEDIGIGDPEAAVTLIVLSIRPQWREEFGGDLAVLDRLLAEACAATKDRSADCGYAVTREGHPDQFPKVPLTSPRSELLTVVAGCCFPPLMRMDAAVRAASAGHNPNRPPTAKLAGLEALFGLYRDVGCPPLLVDACKAYTQKSSDELPLLIPLIWSLWRESGSPTATLEHSVNFEDVGAGMPNYAFDPIHTRPGIQAVKRWLEEVPDKCPWTPRQVAPALWFHESGVCRQTLDWPIAHRLRSDCERGELLRTGVRPDECEDLIHWVRQHYPDLDPVRRSIWTGIYRHARWTDAAFEIVDDASCNQSNES